MKKFALALLTVALFVACSGGKSQLAGNTFTANMKVEVQDTSNMMEVAMAQMAEQLKFKMIFEDGGVLKMSMNADMPGDTTTTEINEDLYSWIEKGDSLILTDATNEPQSFLIAKTTTGVELQGKGLTFALTPVAVVE